MAGKVAANPGANVQIAAGLALFFLEKGETNWLDLGAISNVSMANAVEFLPYSQNRRGSNALTKRFLQDKSFSVQASLEEITPENYRIAFLGGPITAATDPTYVRETATLTVGSDTNNTVTLPETADIVDRIILSTSFSGTDLSHTFTGPASTLVMTDSAITGGEEVVVFYRVNVGAAANNPVKFSIGQNSILEGQAEIRLRQQGGGTGQLIQIPDCEIAPNGDSELSPEAVEAFPIIITARELNGAFALATLFDVA